MVGLSVAMGLINKGFKSIAVIEKEPRSGMHSSGRNSGVLHAGVYYKPGTLRARLCVKGGQRLRNWLEERNQPINTCGKVIVAQQEKLDNQLDLLLDRGRKNGASLELMRIN
jgi:L-2-hydroxyglutarate oxidase LhgO